MIVLYPINSLDHDGSSELLKINIEQIEYICLDPDKDDLSNVKMVGAEDWFNVTNEEASALELFITEIGAPNITAVQRLRLQKAIKKEERRLKNEKGTI